MPVIIMLCAVLAVGVVGYYSLSHSKKEVNYGAPLGNECTQLSDCPTKPGLKQFNCTNGYCEYLNESSNLNTASYANTNIANTNSTVNSSFNQNSNTTANQNTNTAPVNDPKVTLVSSSARVGYITLRWKTDLPTHNTI